MKSYSRNNNNHLIIFLETYYRNPSLGLVTKARAYKGVGQNKSSKVTFHAPKGLRV